MCRVTVAALPNDKLFVKYETPDKTERRKRKQETQARHAGQVVSRLRRKKGVASC